MGKKKQDVIKDIKNNYIQLEKSIVEQLNLTNHFHFPTVGAYREDIWLQLFEAILPKKFVIEHSVFIIDSGEGISREVDLAILDEMYTPYIFRKGRMKYIPIEAVAAVIECKSNSIKTETIKTWYESITSLKTSGESIVRLATTIATESVPTQKSTRPIRILCALKKPKAEGIKECFDFVLSVVSSKSVIEISVNPSCDNLLDWYTSLNFHGVEKNTAILSENQENILKNTTLEQYKVYDENERTISLLSFNFQLNQLLMLINNPLLFPHRKYAEMFGKKEEAPT